MDINQADSWFHITMIGEKSIHFRPDVRPIFQLIEESMPRTLI